ncbi:GNAT family N-acetyltransferase [Cellulomonas sp. PhB143]|uniref:GNAT family N-acetyltransferase n=1 Tax=Cellulomonas sp. PhB143 TaxID=2485186 RepID=UPI000F961890|nr:GNAT family N-acetyltransferase [Cellulomonas sp. PhB143]ROS79043.1 ribosomal protein S18 acetylase RimI-like enzyme [Cellulomonas sp. PhB143]
MPITVRAAAREDLERVVELIADDAVAASRTGAFGPAHVRGFEAIAASPNDELVVAVLDEPAHPRHGDVVGCMQPTVVPGISRAGASRLLVEAVRVDAGLRGRGIGRRMMEHAHAYGRDRGCALAQLTSDKSRPDAHRFYRSLGYAQSHEGFKLSI